MLDALCAWRAEHDWARTDLVALARKHVRGDSQNFDDGEARKGADVDGTSGDVLAARAATGALACLRLAACGDGQALLADLECLSGA